MGVRISPFLLEVGRLSKTAAMVTQCWAATGANLTFLFFNIFFIWKEGVSNEILFRKAEQVL